MSKRNWNELYIPNSILCNPSNLPDPLYFIARPGIRVQDLQVDGLSWKLQKQFCPLRIAAEELVELRNTMYGHGVVDEIDDMTFHDAWIRMERCILMLSSPCKRSDAAKKELEELKISSLDQSLCNQYHTSLLQEFKMSLQIEEALPTATGKLDVIADRMDQFEEKLYSFEDGRRIIILRWDGNNAKCRIPKCIEIGHATGAFIPSESYEGHAMQTGVPSSGNIFNKMMNYVSSAVSCKTYGNQEYEDEDNKMTPQLHYESEEDNEDITSGDEDSSEENDLHICGWCKREFVGLSKFFRHKLRCSRNKQTAEACCSGGKLEATGGSEYNGEIVIENVNDEWTEKAVKKKFKLQKHNHLGFRLTHKERSSLILWTKLSGTMLKDEDTFTTCLEQFVTQIFRQCPLAMHTYVEIRITFTIVEWLAGCLCDNLEIDGWVMSLP
ncbi:uncharacterized protein LOC127714059 [Mytilus californianus]|uniref:uncharacterized protein LOC127714059 n=1 Tax=Mytilus californianus TaxID=6549 RepID=UPI002245A5A3|nr:uncharacterized protein LOC127714059 [Mytilus californianus]